MKIFRDNSRLHNESFQILKTYHQLFKHSFPESRKKRLIINSFHENNLIMTQILPKHKHIYEIL